MDFLDEDSGTGWVRCFALPACATRLPDDCALSAQAVFRHHLFLVTIVCVRAQKLLERIFDKDSFSADAPEILRLAEQLEKGHPPDANS